jgi:hypothetical protein
MPIPFVPLALGLLSAFGNRGARGAANQNREADFQDQFRASVLRSMQFDPNRVRKISNRNMLAASLARAFGLEDALGGRESLLAMSDPSRLPGAFEEGIPGGAKNLPGPDVTNVPGGERSSGGFGQFLADVVGPFGGAGGFDQLGSVLPGKRKDPSAVGF